MSNSQKNVVKFLNPTQADVLKALKAEYLEMLAAMNYAERRLPELEKQIESLKQGKRPTRRVR